MKHGYVFAKELSNYTRICSTESKTIYENVAKQPDATMVFIFPGKLPSSLIMERPTKKKSYTRGEAQE